MIHAPSPFPHLQKVRSAGLPVRAVGRRGGWWLVLLVLGGIMCLSSAAQAQASRPELLKQLKINLAWQIALDEAGFSPGIIDGNFGRRGHAAMAEYTARFFPKLKPLDPKVFAALNVDIEHAITKYKIDDADAAEVGPLPEDWNEKAQLDRLPYDSLQDCLAEKFHCTRALLARLNPGVNLARLTVGQEINVPNLRPFPTPGGLTVPTFPLTQPATEPAESAAETHPATTHASTTRRQAHQYSDPVPAYISINLTQKCIRVFDKEDQQIALFHCSVAQNKAKLPARDTRIKNLATPPNYTFDPKHWPEVNNVDRVLTIPPGPRNPVGLAWMGLDLPGYGIHGNPKPELIGKTGSHGCFRLTNWDALRLYSMVHPGMPVKIVDPQKAGTEDKDD